MANTIIKRALHHCLDCAHYQEGTLDWGKGEWTCNVCGHLAVFVTGETTVKVTA